MINGLGHVDLSFSILVTRGNSAGLKYRTRRETKKITGFKSSTDTKIQINNDSVIQYFPISAFKTLPIPVEPLLRGNELTNKVYNPGTTTTVKADKMATVLSTLKKKEAAPRLMP
ncbi:MAG: hypothetical protein VXX78_06695 [Pseudomonadota bacterium]|nr:hypothetical protein [Pseudomonadota bacterium]